MKRMSALVILMLTVILCVPSYAAQAAELSAPKVSLKTTSADNPKLTWDAVSGADGYRVYRKTSSDSKYVKVTSTKKLSFTDKKWSASEGSTVKYYVKAYTKDKNGKVTTGKQSSVKSWSVPVKTKSKTKVTPKPTATPKPTVTPAVKRTVSEPDVWIPTNGGRKYHCKSTCSNMKNPKKVTRSEAVRQGFTQCAKCW